VVEKTVRRAGEFLLYLNVPIWYKYVKNDKTRQNSFLRRKT